MFIHLYLVDVRHFQNHTVVYILALFWRPFWPSALGAGTDQAMLLQITAAGTAPSINYRTGRIRINKNFTDF